MAERGRRRSSLDTRKTDARKIRKEIHRGRGKATKVKIERRILCKNARKNRNNIKEQGRKRETKSGLERRFKAAKGEKQK